MSAEINIAAASLIFATIAFIVALAQLFQSVLGPLEGYRRCGKSSIGAWHQFRSRRPVISEFRLEVKFMTPHFSLLTSDWSDWDDAEKSFGPTYDLATLSRPAPRGKERKGFREILRGLPSLENKTLENLKTNSPSLSDPEKIREEITKPGLVERVARLLFSSHTLEKFSNDSDEKQDSRRRDLAQSASWLGLLEAVQHTYSDHYQKSIVPKVPESTKNNTENQLEITKDDRSTTSLLTIAAVSFLHQ